MCFTNVNEAGIRYRYFMYSTNKCTDFNKNITLYKKKKKKKKKKKSLVSIGLVLSEEKIFEKVYDVRRRRTPSDRNSSHDPLGQVS
jgi:hypothetical protein